MFFSKTQFVIILFMLLCAPLCTQGLARPKAMPAQNYIYPVATGTSWGPKLFEQIEKEQAEKNAQHPRLENAPDFAGIFTQFYQNYKDHHQYDDSIFVDMPHQEWIAMFNRRAQRYSELYANNNSMARTLKDYFSGEEVPDAAYDSLYFWTRHLYHRNMSDIFLLEQMVDDILIPHYEAAGDTEHLMFCYSCSGLVHYQCTRIGDNADAEKSLAAFRRAMGLKNRFAWFKNPFNRYYFISAFVNICVLHAQDGNVSMEESRRLLSQMQSLFATPEVKRLFAEDPQLKDFAGWAVRLYCLRSIMTYISHDMNDIFLFGELYSDYGSVRASFNENFSDAKFRYYAKLNYDDLIIEAFMGNISWDKAYERFVDALRHDPDLATPTGFSAYRMNYMNNLFTSHIYLVERTTMSEADKKAAVKDMLERVLDVIAHFEHIQFPFEKGQIMSNIATHPSLVKYLTTEEKQDLLYRLLVLEQPTTFVHVSMVADLLRILTEALIDQQPSYFAPIPGCESADTVRAYRKELSDYVHQAAIFHDAGKILMPTVVNNNFRRLTDHEYNIMRMHPEKAAPLFAVDDSFRKYAMVALGHHKWYNGGGYPASYNNRASLEFQLINIVTLCDCMDAATENVGRNYHSPKPFDAVMQEFVEGAGTRYDPTLVKFIMENPNLYAQLRQKVLVGRMQHYYQMYSSYLK